MNNIQKSLSFRVLVGILILGIFNLSMGCHYYKVKSYNSPYQGDLYSKPGDYMIVHFENTSWNLDKFKIDRRNNIISGNKSEITIEHMGHNNPKPKVNRYKKKMEKPDNEVHIYIDEFIENENGKISIPISKIQRIDVYDKNTDTTVASYILGGLLLGAAALVIIMIIVILTKSSCPFIYIHKDGQYIFVGETFGGAVAKNLERDDYMELPDFKPQNDEYKIMISNELMERQYTDIAQLIVVEHPENTNVLLDNKGNIFTLSNPILPKSAVSEQEIDHVKALLTIDGTYYSFLDENKDKDEFSSINLSFPNKMADTSANLILNLKNTMWLEYTFDLFNAQLGDKFDEFAEIRANSPTEKNLQWAKNQGLPLAVKINTNEGWKLIEYVDMIGPLAFRNIVIPLNEIDKTKENIEVKLECGFHFWEVDYAAIDFTKDINPKSYRVDCTSAYDENDINVKESLSKIDENYLTQLNIGNEAFLVYPAPLSPPHGYEHSTFLYSRGYYEPIREYSGKPKLWKLRSFWKKGGFTQFAKENFNKISEFQ